MRTFFISYRRADSQAFVGRIQDHLLVKMRGTRIFRDVDNIPPGVDFRNEIQRLIGESDVVLAVIGPDWADARDERGMRRLEKPFDAVRTEIHSAMSLGKALIPLLVGGAKMPKPEQLPSDLKDLAYRNAFPIRHDPDFLRDVERLIEHLKQQPRTTRSAAFARPSWLKWPSWLTWTVWLAGLRHMSAYVWRAIRSFPRPTFEVWVGIAVFVVVGMSIGTLAFLRQASKRPLVGPASAPQLPAEPASVPQLPTTDEKAIVTAPSVPPGGPPSSTEVVSASPPTHSLPPAQSPSPTPQQPTPEKSASELRAKEMLHQRLVAERQALADRHAAAIARLSELSAPLLESEAKARQLQSATASLTDKLESQTASTLKFQQLRALAENALSALTKGDQPEAALAKMRKEVSRIDEIVTTGFDGTRAVFNEEKAKLRIQRRALERTRDDIHAAQALLAEKSQVVAQAQALERQIAAQLEPLLAEKSNLERPLAAQRKASEELELTIERLESEIEATDAQLTAGGADLEKARNAARPTQ